MEQNQTTSPFFSVRDVHNKRVYDALGNDCGHVSSILFDSEDAQLLFAIIKFEEDVESKGSTAIPWNSLSLNPNTGKVDLKINRNILLGAPRIDNSDFKLSNRNTYYNLLKYYGYSSNIQSPDSPINQDTRGNYHQQFEGEEFTRNPKDDRNKNSLGDEMDFEKIKGRKIE
jgi:hypothetical protein